MLRRQSRSKDPVQALDKLLKTEDGNLLDKKNLFVRADALCSLVFDIRW